MGWYRKDLTRIFNELKTSSQGLSAGEAAERLKRLGPNELVEKKKKPKEAPVEEDAAADAKG